MSASEGRSRFTLGKAQRLKSKAAFTYLFEHGSSLRVGVLKIFFALDPPLDLGDEPIQVAISAPKRSFKRAPDRNYLKRRMREAYRLHQFILSDALRRKQHRMILLISYQNREKHDYDRIRRSMVKALHMLRSSINDH
mgnify:CR=1 FL=1